MQENRKTMAGYCRKAEACVSGRILFAGMTPHCCTNFNNYSRFILCLEGSKKIHYGDGKQELYAVLEPGDAVFVPGCGQEEEVWDLPHEMISCVFMNSFTRVIHIRHSGEKSEHAAPDIFFHLKKEEITGDSKLAELIMELKEQNPEISASLLKTLLKLLADALEKEPDSADDEPEWQRICEAMHQLFRGDISREDVARLSGVSARQLSQLIRKHTHRSFCEFLTGHRLEHARMLLLQSSLQVREIAALSGFSYTSYFIRLFHMKYGCTPELFRRNPPAEKP